MDAKDRQKSVNEILGIDLADAFERDFNKALEDAGEAGVVTMAMIDMDAFIIINQNFGHAAGDKAIIEACTHLRDGLPDGAKFYRYAGDSFSVLFPEGVEKEEAFLTMERLRAAYPVKAPDGTQQTITIGIASAPEDGTRYLDLVRKADGAMYRGKISGRNKVCLAREEKMVTKTSHYTTEQLQRLTKLSKREGMGEAILLREALDALLKKYDV